MGWLKGFVHSRALPAPSLVKGFCIHMLARRAPEQIRDEFHTMYSQEGRDLTQRGHLVPLEKLIETRGNRPGCGNVTVQISRRNAKVLDKSWLEPTFLERLAEYNMQQTQSNQIHQGNERTTFWEMLQGTYEMSQEYNTPYMHFLPSSRHLPNI